jgi:hypothetical protein
LRNWRSVIVASSLIAVASVSVWSLAEQGPPATYLSRARDTLSGLIGRSRVPVDTQDDASGRTPVACPPANDRTMVALVFGQSQAANVVKERFVGDSRVFNYFQGHCYAAADPLLGTDHGGGNVWTLVGTQLVQQKRFEAAIFVTIAVSGSYIGEWAPGGRLHGHLLRAVASIGPDLAFTHVFVHRASPISSPALRLRSISPVLPR